MLGKSAVPITPLGEKNGSADNVQLKKKNYFTTVVNYI